MEIERRSNSRVTINATSQFLISKGDHYQGDFEGIVKDISEDGIGVIVNDAKYFPIVDTLKTQDILFFQAFDEYTVFMKKTSDIFQGKVKILRIEKKDSEYNLGCLIISSNRDLDSFISRRKMAFYIDGMSVKKD